jgi:hypothetical protein
MSLTIIEALQALSAATTALQTTAAGIQKFASMIAQAQSEGREGLNDADLDQLAAEDDLMSKAVDDEIARRLTDA